MALVVAQKEKHKAVADAREEQRIQSQIDAREERYHPDRPIAVPDRYGVMDAAPGMAYMRTTEMCERDPSCMLRGIPLFSARQEMQKMINAPAIVEAIAPPLLTLPRPEGIAHEH
jgi:hypothetical protein